MAKGYVEKKLTAREWELVYDAFAEKAIKAEMDDKNSDLYWAIAFKAQRNADQTVYSAGHQNSLEKWV